MPNWAWVFTATIALVALATLLMNVRDKLIEEGRWRERVDYQSGNFDTFMKSVSKDLKKILKHIKAREGVATAESPLRLTERGDEIASSLGAVEWAKDEAKALVAEVADSQPFQIDDFAKKHVEAHLGNWDTKFAECSYEFGVPKEELPIVLRIVLRDELLRLTGQALPPI